MAIPGPPVMTAEVADKVRELTALGFAGTVFLTTDDIQKSYDELRARGVEFVGPPEQQPYGWTPRSVTHLATTSGWDR